SSAAPAVRRSGRAGEPWWVCWARRARWIWRRTKTDGSPAVRDSLPRPPDRQSALAADRARRSPARRLSPGRRQFRIDIANHRWSARPRLLRLARTLLLRFGRQAPVEPGFWRYAHLERLWRRQFAGTLQRLSDCHLGP